MPDNWNALESRIKMEERTEKKGTKLWGMIKSRAREMRWTRGRNWQVAESACVKINCFFGSGCHVSLMMWQGQEQYDSANVSFKQTASRVRQERVRLSCTWTWEASKKCTWSFSSCKQFFTFSNETSWIIAKKKIEYELGKIVAESAR